LKLIDALKLPSLKQARVVAGMNGLGREIRWVHIVDLPDPLPWISSGDFLLTTGFAWPHDESALRMLIVEMAKRGLTGVALAVPHFFNKMPNAACKAAEELDFPLIEIPWEVPFNSVTEEILNSILAFHYKLQEQSEFIHRELFRVALEAKSLQDIAYTLGKLINKSVMIQHPEGPILAYFNVLHEEKPEMWDKEVKDIMLKQVFSRLIEHPSSSIHLNSQSFRIPPTPEYGLLERLVCPIHIKREMAGLLWIFEGSSPLHEQDVRSVEFAAIVIALHISQQRALVALEAQLGYSFLDALLEGRYHHSAQDMRRAELLGFDSEGAYSVGMVVLDLPVPLSREGILKRERLSERLKRDLQELQIPAVLSPVQNQLFFLLPERIPAKAIWPLIESPHLSFAVSLVHQGFGEVQQGFKEVCSIVSHLNFGNMYHYKDLLVPRVLMGDPEARSSFLNQLLAPIQKSKNGEELIKTLLMFTREGFHHKNTAAQLNLHIKTLRYRLDRVISLSGYDLNDPDTRFQLQLALKIQSL
jgi:PucR family transcriptional regulator, purine catabolism regulatory protein